MTITKWNEKVSAILDKYCDENIVKYANTEEGVYFTDKAGYSAYFLPKHHCYSVHGKSAMENPKSSSPMIAEVFRKASDNGKLAETVTSGKANGKCARRFTLGDMEVFCYEKYLRVFPKNADFYISAPTAPIPISIWENGKANILGIVMPFRNNGSFSA